MKNTPLYILLFLVSQLFAACSLLEQVASSPSVQVAFAPEQSLEQNLELPLLQEKPTQAIQQWIATQMQLINSTSTIVVDTIQAGEVIKVELWAQPLFNPNQTTLLPTASEPLQPLKELLQATSGYLNIALVAHTDHTGSASYTQHLTQQRAEALKGWIESIITPVAPIATYAKGASEPLFPNTSVANRTMNRRFELYLIPNSHLYDLAQHGKLYSTK